MLDPALKSKIYEMLKDIVGPDHVTIHETDAVLNAHDAWPLSEAKIRAGEILPLADFIVFPNSADEVSRILKLANEHRIPIVPVGGGAGTCGGTLPTRGGIQLDLKRMNQVIAIDHDSLTVRAQAGIIGIDLEEYVNRFGYITGHTPTSLRASNLGGFIATRSGGSMSSLYGKIEDLTLGIQVVLPNGDIIELKAVPRHSVGPDLKQLFIGSEGTLGVITEATLKLFKKPEHRSFRSMSFKDISTGLIAIREIFQSGITPSVVRLYDAEDTAMSMSGHFEIPEGDCMLLLAFDGRRELVTIDEQASVEICLKHSATDYEEGPSKRWWEHRYDMYYPTKYTTAGFSVGDTIDIVATYDKLENVYHAMKEAMEAHDAIVMSHFSHMYPNGGSIYMIFFLSAPDAESAWAKYKKVWDDGVAACHKEGGTMSHQHGVGLNRTTYTEGEWGPAFQILIQIKNLLDPNGIMNPDKLGFRGEHT